jgi:NADPH:quinone reductase-like Zn-dependent oxidoreductase
VTQFQTGDEVFGTCDGSFAEYAFTPQDMVARKPADLRAGGGTHPAFALQALRDAGSIKSGQRVLIVESSGGVGLCSHCRCRSLALPARTRGPPCGM